MRLLPRDEKFFDLFSAVAEFTVAAAELQRGSYHQRSHFQRPPCPRGSPVPRLSPAEASTALRNSERFYPRDAWLSLLDLKGRPSAL